MENIEKTNQHEYICPDFEHEREEIELAADLYRKDKAQEFVAEFIKRGLNQTLEDLTDTVWSNLKNTDSMDIAVGDWEHVRELSAMVERDWETKKKDLETGQPTEAPIIMKFGNLYHKVSGNTRLMVARAAGMRPKVLIVDMSDYVEKKK